MKDILSYKVGAYIFFFTAALCLIEIIILLSQPIALTVLFHEVYDNKLDEFGIDEKELKNKIQEFLDNGYKPITAQEFETYLDSGFPLFSKNVLITFDDGKNSSAEAIKMLYKDYGIKSVFFIITDFINGKNMVTESELKNLQETYGCTIGLHGKRHEEVTKIVENGENLTQELKEASKIISNITKTDVKWYAYPYGENNKDSYNQVKNAGFSYIFTIESAFITEQTSKHALPRVMYSRHAPQNGLSDISDYAKVGYKISDFKFHIIAAAILIFMGTLYIHIEKKLKKEKQNSL